MHPNCSVAYGGPSRPDADAAPHTARLQQTIEMTQRRDCMWRTGSTTDRNQLSLIDNLEGTGSSASQAHLNILKP